MAAFNATSPPLRVAGWCNYKEHTSVPNGTEWTGMWLWVLQEMKTRSVTQFGGRKKCSAFHLVRLEMAVLFPSL